MAACLFGGSGTLASHRAAGALWQLDGFDSPIIEIATPRRLRAPEIVIHRTARSRLRPAEIGGIPVTDAARTLLDVGAVVRPGRVEAALDDALRRRLVTIPALLERLQQDGGRGRRGAGILRQLVERRDPEAAAPESVLETRVARLLDDAGLPPPVRQFEVREGGRLLGRVDFAWPEHLLALEADGYRFHSGRTDWRHDRTRRNLLTGSGWRVLHVTWDDLTEAPELLVAQLRRFLTTVAAANR